MKTICVIKLWPSLPIRIKRTLVYFSRWAIIDPYPTLECFRIRDRLSSNYMHVVNSKVNENLVSEVFL